MIHASEEGEDLKPILSKETFCKALQMIREQEQVDHEFSKALELVGDGHFIYGVQNKYQNALMLVLKEAVNDKYDYIEWWVYEESSDYMVYSADDQQKWDLHSPEALYDYIVTECQESPGRA